MRNIRDDNKLLEKLTQGARELLPGLQYCGEPNAGQSFVSEPLLNYVVALLHGRPIPPPEATEAQWRRLLASLRFHWMIPLVYYRIGSLDAALAPPKEIMAALRLGFLQSGARCAQMERQLAELLAAFEKEGLSFLVLKGPALAHSVYPDAATRPAADLDILVQPALMSTARRILEQMGYTCLGRKYAVARQIYREELFIPPAAKAATHRWIEVHWDLTELAWPGRAQRVQGLFDRAMTVEAAGMAFWALSPADALIHRALNNGWHYRDLRLIWICDGALLARQLQAHDQWHVLQELGSVWRCRLALELTLELGRAWTGLRLPRGVDDLAAWPPATTQERRQWAALTGRHANLTPYLRELLKGSTGVPELLRACLHMLFPDPAWMRLKYPPAEGRQLLVAYARRWLRWVQDGFD